MIQIGKDALILTREEATDLCTALTLGRESHRDFYAAAEQHGFGVLVREFQTAVRAMEREDRQFWTGDPG